MIKEDVYVGKRAMEMDVQVIAASQTAHHIASECPLHSCGGDLVTLNTAAHNWLRDLQRAV